MKLFGHKVRGQLKLVATYKSAILAGMWCAAGMSALDSLEQGRVEFATSGLINALSMIVFFFAPLTLFVIGPDFFGQCVRDRFAKGYWKQYLTHYRQGCLRMLCWFVGVAVIWLPLYGWKYLR